MLDPVWFVVDESATKRTARGEEQHRCVLVAASRCGACAKECANCDRRRHAQRIVDRRQAVCRCELWWITCERYTWKTKTNTISYFAWTNQTNTNDVVGDDAVFERDIKPSLDRAAAAGVATAGDSDEDSDWSDEEGAECAICQGMPEHYCKSCATPICGPCHLKVLSSRYFVWNWWIDVFLHFWLN